MRLNHTWCHQHGSGARKQNNIVGVESDRHLDPNRPSIANVVSVAPNNGGKEKKKKKKETPLNKLPPLLSKSNQAGAKEDEG